MGVLTDLKEKLGDSAICFQFLKYKSKYIVTLCVNKHDIPFNTGWLNIDTLKFPF